MSVLYVLSNAQRKELLIRGRSLRIALPAPPNEVRNPADWAKASLLEDLRPYVRSAEQVELLLRPKISTVRSTLTALLGDIVEEGDLPWAISVIAIVATLKPANPRNSTFPIQWPSNVLINGQLLLRPDGADAADSGA